MPGSQNRSRDVSSPESLDELFTVVNTRSWMALLALLFLIAMAIVWLIYGTIPYYVQGTGMIIKTSGLKTLYANTSGRIESLEVSVGEKIKRGQVIAIIPQSDLQHDIDAIAEQITEFKILLTQRDQLRQLQISNVQERVDVLKRRAQAQKKLLDEGLLTESRYIETIDALKNAISEDEKIEVEAINDQNELKDLLRKERILKNRYKRDANIKSTHDGLVVEIKETVGSIIQPGTPLIAIESTNSISQDTLSVYIYIPASEAKKVKADMPITVTPTFINPEEFGSLKGTVENVSTYPATQQAMLNILQNKTLVESILQKSIPVQVKAKLTQNHQTISGLAWTSKEGAPMQIQSGTLCDAKIKVLQKRPLELVLPKLKELIGWQDE